MTTRLVLCVALLLGAVLAAPNARSQAETPARHFTLRDDGGRAVARLSLTADGWASLARLDEEEQPEATLYYPPHVVRELRLTQAGGVAQVRLTVDRAGGWRLDLHHESGRPYGGIQSPAPGQERVGTGRTHTWDPPFAG